MRSTNRLRSLLLALVAFAFATAIIPATLSAGITAYTNEAAFTAATSGLTNLDFNGIAPSGSYVYYGNGPLTLSGVNITSNGSMYVIDPGYYGFPYSGGGFLNSDYTSPDILEFVLPGSYTAVGFNFGSLFSGGATFSVQLDGTCCFSFSTTGSTQDNDLGFAGLISTVPFSTVFVTMPDAPNYNAIDNFRFGSGSAVPEPGTLILLGSAALAGLGLLRRKLSL